MSNVVKILKAEIARISKKEAKSATQAIGKSNTWLRKTVADLKKRLVVIEKENKRLVATVKKFQEAQPEKVEQVEGKKARFTSKGVRALRKKLRLSQADFGKLVGATPHAVYLWEKKIGALNLRAKTKAAILSVRGLAAREAKEKLAELGKKLKKVKVAASKKRSGNEYNWQDVFSQVGIESELSMIEEIQPNLFRVEVPLPNSPLKFLNSYVIRSSGRNLIVDTGLNRKECLDAMQLGLKQLDIDLARTDFFITHLHADHFGLVSKLATSTSQVFFNRPETELIEASGWWERMVAYAAKNGFPENELQAAIKSHPGREFASEWVPEISILQDGDEIIAGNYRFKCVSTPGHSLGHTCLYEPNRKILVAGDHILIDITPNIQCWSDDHNPLENYLKSLDKVNDMEIDLVLPGHRRLITDHRARIAELKEHHQRRLREVLSILGDDSQTAYQVASQMTWDLDCDSWEQFPRAQKWFATGEGIAHLRYLEKKGFITRRDEGAMTRFTRNDHPGLPDALSL